MAILLGSVTEARSMCHRIRHWNQVGFRAAADDVCWSYWLPQAGGETLGNCPQVSIRWPESANRTGDRAAAIGRLRRYRTADQQCGRLAAARRFFQARHADPARDWHSE